MKSYIKFPLLFAALVISFSAFAQTADNKENTDSIGSFYEQLDEFVIEAERPVIQTDGAKLTYNVEEDPAANTTNALDMLKKVPQISVDGEGTIRLNGSTDFKLQLNGIENPMLKQYADKILEGMPANLIVKVEVITEPGAKGDAEGNAGIINIVTERSGKNDGYNGQISLNADNRGLTPSISALFKKDKVTLSANLNYQWGYAPMEAERNSETIYKGEGQTGSTTTFLTQKMKHNFLGGGLNMSWEPNAKNLFTAGVNIFWFNGDIRALNETTQMFDAQKSRIWSFGQTGSGDVGLFSISPNVSYRHNFVEEGDNYLVLSYQFNFGNNYFGIDQQYNNLINYNPGFIFQNQKSRTYNREHTVQVDYANDFHSEKHLLEVGGKGIFRHNSAVSNYLVGDEAENLVLLPEMASDIMQLQNIYAAYASYTGSFGKFGLVAGLRYEHTLMGVDNRNNALENFRNRLNDWVPNAALTWNFTNASNLRLAYQMRITRPSIMQVNPFQMAISPTEIRMGNPDLESEHNHKVSMKYSGFGRVVGGSVGVEYSQSDNAISDFTYLLQENGMSAIVSSFANIGKRQDVVLTGYFNWNILKQMSFAFNGRLAYNYLNAPSEGYKNSGWSGNIGAAWNYTVADVYKFSAFGAWISRSLTVQGYNPSFYYYGLSASRDFLADKSLTIGVRAQNFAQKSMSYNSFSETANMLHYNSMKNLSSWSVGVSITWKFGKLNASVKNTGVNLKNDDVESSSSSSSRSPGGIL